MTSDRARMLCSLALVALSAVPAFADGWKIQLQGAKALGLGYAGRALPEDASAVWFNPAGLTALELPEGKRVTWTAGGALVPFTLDFTDRGSRSLLGQPLSGPSRQNGGLTPPLVPHAYIAWQGVKSLWFGVGITAPHGLSDDYGTEWVGRYHATEGTLTVLNINGTVAHAITETLSIGGGLDIQKSSATLANSLDFGSIGAALGLPLIPQAHDGTIGLESGDWALGFDLSAAWQPLPRARFAATYRSAVEHTLRGTATFDVPPSAALLQAGGAFRTTGAEAVLPMPQDLTLSVAVALDDSSAARPTAALGRYVLVADVTWTDWSRFQELNVSFDNASQPPLTQAARYVDSVRGAAGLVYRHSDRLTLRGGALYEKSPVPDLTRTPRLPEVNNVGISAGFTWKVRGVDLDVGWSGLVPHDAPITLTDPSAGVLLGDLRWRTNAFAVSLGGSF